MQARTGFGASSWDDRGLAHDAPYAHDAHYAHAQYAPADVDIEVDLGLSHAAAPGPLEEAIWMVWVEGGEVIGPVSAQQLARGIRAGRVPAEASVQRAGEVFWTGILDETDIISALKSL